MLPLSTRLFSHRSIPLRKILEQDVSVTHAGHIQHVNVRRSFKVLRLFFTDFLDFIMYFSTLSVPESQKVDLLHDQCFPGVGPPGHKEHHTERPLNVTHEKQGRKVQGKIEQSCRRLS